MRLLVTADLHLGRHGSHIPEDLRDGRYRAASVWMDCVEAALDRNVDHVLLAGDILDRKNRFFEALGPFERGCRKLGEAGIPIWLVAGNHDQDLLENLDRAAAGETLRLLGQGGNWETVELEDSSGRALLRLAAWSFPSRHYESSPLETFPPLPSDALPCLALLHGEIGASTSPYAPLAMDALQDRAPLLWVVGHTHAPTFTTRPGKAAVLVPGSPMAFDPGEPGIHGPWIVELQEGRLLPPTQLPLSPVRYETLDLDMGEFEKRGSLQGDLPRRLKSELKRVAGLGGKTHLVLWRLALRGRVPPERHLEEELQGIRRLELEEDEILGRIDRLALDVRPAIDLEVLASGKTSVAVLARLLLELERGEPISEEFRPLVAEMGQSLDELTGERIFDGAELPPLASLPWKDEILRPVAWRLLEALLRQEATP